MKIDFEFKLENPKKCDGCPLEYDTICCKHPKEEISKAFHDMQSPGNYMKRPVECIERCGK